jgi:hypothetical protein
VPAAADTPAPPLSSDAPKPKRLSFAPRMPLSKRTEYSGAAPASADAALEPDPQPEEGPASAEGPASPAEGPAVEAAAAEAATEAEHTAAAHPPQQGADPPLQGADPPAADAVAAVDEMLIPDDASQASLHTGASGAHASLHTPRRSTTLSYDEVAAAAAAQVPVRGESKSDNQRD